MPKTDQNLDGLTAGDTIEITIPVVDSTNAPENLNAATIRWGLAPWSGATPLIIKSTADGGISIPDATNGIFRVHLAPEETEDFAGTYYHEAEVTDSEGRVATTTKGFLTFSEDTV